MSVLCTQPLSIVVTLVPCTYDLQVSWTPGAFDLGNHAAFSFEGEAGVFTIESDRTGLDSSDVAGYGLRFVGLPDLQSIQFNSLLNTGPGGGYAILCSDCPNLTVFEFNALTTCSQLAFSNNAAMASLSFPALVDVPVGNGLFITSNNALLSVSMPLFQNSLALQISLNPLLTTITLTAFSPTDGVNYDFSVNALDQATVDAILANAAATLTYISGFLQLQGGTNSPPSAAGVINAGIISARGVTVTTN